MTPTTLQARSVSEALADCRRQQGDWADLLVARRLVPVRRFRQLLVDRVDDICAALARDLGKSTAESIGGDILPLADACRYLGDRTVSQ